VSTSAVAHDGSGKLLVAAALENVAVWNLKSGTLVRTLVPARGVAGRPVGEVTQLALSPCSPQVAAGHTDGSVRVWNLETGDCDVTLTGHKTAVTALRFHSGGLLLASGSQDTNIVVWDVVGEAGLYKLSGHRDQVTDVAFLEKANKLVSCSKDSYVKVWDMETRHCCQTVVGYKGEIWSLDVDPSQQRLAVGSNDSEVRVYAIAPAGSGDHAVGQQGPPPPKVQETAAGAAEGEEDAAEANKRNVLVAMGSLKRTAPGRCSSVRYSTDGHLLGVLSIGKGVEVFRALTAEEAKKKMKRRKKRRKEKAAAGKEEAGDWEVADEGPTVSDEMAPLVAYFSKHKIRSFSFRGKGGRDSSRGRLDQLALGLTTNAVEVVDVMQDGTANKVSSLDHGGHRADVRCVRLSSDDSLALSTSSNSAKVWNLQTGACVRTIESGYGLSCMWAPGDRHAVIGTKDGKLQIINVGMASVIETVDDAHSGAVWSLSPLPDRSGFVSGSADKTVKFWEWSLAEGEDGGPKQLSCENTRTLKLTDDVLCCRLSPDGRLLAVALLDCTIKVFFTDSLKFSLSLYGHKLPVLCMDISSDGTLLASGSADKNIKFWGLDFGDCHRSVFAHNDSVMDLAFVNQTHYCFTVGKDGALKYWDADKWELLLELNAHHSEVWCCAVSSNGDYVVTGGHDKSLRRWERTDEPFFVEEEREKRLESLFEADLESQQQRAASEGIGSDGKAGVAGERTLESLTATDKIVEALEMAANETKRIADSKPGEVLPPNVLMLGMRPSQYVLKAVSSVRPADLEQALMCLPFTSALELLGYLRDWLQCGTKVELTARLAVLLLRLHHVQLVGTPAARTVLAALRGLLRPRVAGLRDLLGCNIAALQHLQRAHAAEKAGFGEAGPTLPIKRTISEQ